MCRNIYTLWWTGSLREKVIAVAHCTARDIMIASLSLLTELLLFGVNSWPAQRVGSVFATAVTLGIAYTIYSEWLDTSVRENSAYSQFMPTLPAIGTGLSPLLHWIVVPTAVMPLALRRACRPI